MIKWKLLKDDKPIKIVVALTGPMDVLGPSTLVLVIAEDRPDE